jgi:hypothetical protein
LRDVVAFTLGVWRAGSGNFLGAKVNVDAAEAHNLLPQLT